MRRVHSSPLPQSSAFLCLQKSGVRRTDAYFSNGGGDGSARHSTEKPAYGCLFLGKQNRISQQTRVQLNQFTKLTYGPVIQQQLHMPKREGRGVPGGRQLVATPRCALLLGQPGRFNCPEPHWPYLEYGRLLEGVPDLIRVKHLASCLGQRVHNKGKPESEPISGSLS